MEGKTMAVQSTNRSRQPRKNWIERVPRGDLKTQFAYPGLRGMAELALRQYVSLLPEAVEQKLQGPGQEATLQGLYALRALERETDLVAQARAHLEQQLEERRARKRAADARNAANKAARAMENRSRAKSHMGGKKNK